MNNNDFYSLLKEARKTFPKHKRIKVCLKETPTNPFGSTYIAKFIENKDFPEYELYIHTNYITIKCLSNEKKFEPVKISIDDELWIELISTFDFVKIFKKNEEV